jgi:hypothetical protein
MSCRALLTLGTIRQESRAAIFRFLEENAEAVAERARLGTSPS